MSILRAAVFAALFVLTPICARAQDITLTSQDGAMSLSGVLVGYDGEFYRVETEFGVLTLDGSGVICSGPACPNLDGYVAEISVSGARTVGDVLLPSLFERFAARHGYTVTREVESNRDFTLVLKQSGQDTEVARIDFALGNSDQGLARFVSGETDFALSLREANEDEITIAREAGLGDLRSSRVARIIGLDGVVPIVSKRNTVTSISLEQTSKVFAGEIKNWQELGGIDAPIVLHLREDGSGVLERAVSQILTDEDSELAQSRRHTSNASLSAAVARDPFAIGIVSHSEIGNSRPLALLGGCGFPFMASHSTIKSEDYPLTSPLFLYTPARRLPKIIREFMAFMSTPSAEQIVEASGFVNQASIEIPMADQGERLANAVLQAGDEVSLSDVQEMVGALRSARRLSTTFRFEAGSSLLDAQSRANVSKLAEELEAGLFEDRKLLFVGFSDGDGGAAANRRIAMRRAQAVRAAVLKEASLFDPERMEIGELAFGEAMPMACDDTEWGRQVNRRVEVWLAPVTDTLPREN
ncbi:MULTISPECIES: phosphate ABC transporter substrate-binding/OmpA family protein [Halocynthiibacter]|uniref:Phosphate ABC transporter substrate-binding/OmpA family protein n=1 Tax=Halocynthiibacter halioticoli TaxID=2986804 RepID=A0AAE3J0K2_9RHOB|nr:MULTISPECIES: phosphate ABC transporter substrate-binding/OmpA family protein [Halocynthiibacter]MCV6825558.1 phosphate ABC transporter substrate-binding/OmpA family protein [Halocynthiibacter halioticoli]MCW4058559.1 phosphate ABC transporter substrate-binding/OmpA family protein [Halocynthiibacter sp. SDUM655004]